VKIPKLALVVCGAIGLVVLIAPFSGRSLVAEYFAVDRVAAIVDTAIFVLSAAMGAIALARPPMRPWQSGVALASCVLGVVRFHVWELALHLPGVGLRGALLLVAIVIGTIGAIASLLRPEAV
jgi:hypothetical protein